MEGATEHGPRGPVRRSRSTEGGRPQPVTLVSYCGHVRREIRGDQLADGVRAEIDIVVPELGQVVRCRDTSVTRDTKQQW
jgi:hypothetical protein